jgi:hypothetical protein
MRQRWRIVAIRDGRRWIAMSASRGHANPTDRTRRNAAATGRLTFCSRNLQGVPCVKILSRIATKNEQKGATDVSGVECGSRINRNFIVACCRERAVQEGRRRASAGCCSAPCLGACCSAPFLGPGRSSPFFGTSRCPPFCGAAASLFHAASPFFTSAAFLGSAARRYSATGGPSYCTYRNAARFARGKNSALAQYGCVVGQAARTVACRA